MTEREIREALQQACGRLDEVRRTRGLAAGAKGALLPLVLGAGLAAACASETSETVPLYSAVGPDLGGASAGGSGGEGATSATGGSGGELVGGAMPGYGVFGGFGGEPASGGAGTGGAGGEASGGGPAGGSGGANG